MHRGSQWVSLKKPNFRNGSFLEIQARSWIVLGRYGILPCLHPGRIDPAGWYRAISVGDRSTEYFVGCSLNIVSSPIIAAVQGVVAILATAV